VNPSVKQAIARRQLEILDDGALLRRLGDGDEEAWREVIARIDERARDAVNASAAPAAVEPRPSRMMRVEDVAARWDVNVKTLYAMIKRGELPARRFGRVVRVPRFVVESFEQASVAPERKK
jgi:excisionase family DNA binding protein